MCIRDRYDKKIFMYFKEMGAKWTAIAKKLRNKTGNEVKNRFYSILRRVATKICGEKGEPVPQIKEDLIKFVDVAIKSRNECKSKQGKKEIYEQKDNLDKLESTPLPSIDDWEKSARSAFPKGFEVDLPNFRLPANSINPEFPPIASLFSWVTLHPTIEQLQLFRDFPFLFPQRPLVFPQESVLTNLILHQSFDQ
eukprot:TRINITY_DN35751_c0_g1_i2.p1 TRINITY_DN35751_c0_g1~~TRINITY_DN35751_c0_g1_i2.p1  ORF type:complete len:195 (+),score=18.42 TRINITY_DN35751_c0_g1_i2:183-767(+)